MKMEFEACVCAEKACNMHKHPVLIVRGVDRDTKAVFRPRDWASRLLGLVSTMSPCGRQMSPRCLSERYEADGTKGLCMSTALAHAAPWVYEQVLGFANSNNLLTATKGCPTLLHPANTGEVAEVGIDEY